MDCLKYLYFFSASGIFTFAVAPFLWLGSLFVARINRLQIIKSVLFLLMYGHFIFYSIISQTMIDAEKSAENTLLVLLERICGFLLFSLFVCTIVSTLFFAGSTDAAFGMRYALLCFNTVLGISVFFRFSMPRHWSLSVVVLYLIQLGWAFERFFANPGM